MLAGFRSFGRTQSVTSPRLVDRSIDRFSAVPYYYQLQEILKEDLDSGRWGPGELMPSEADLVSLFGVSRTVIRKALDLLEGEGRVVRIKGKGTVVASPKLRYEAVAEPGMWKKAWRTLPSLHRIIDARRATVGGHLGKVLGLSPASEVFELTYVQAIEGNPSSLSQTFIREDASPVLARLASEGDGVPKASPGGPDFLKQLVEGYGVHVRDSEVTIEAGLATEFESKMLGVPLHTPVFVLSSIDSGPDGSPLAFTRTAVRSDYFRFTVMIRLNLEPTRGGSSGQSNRRRSDGPSPR
jgi:GntR family transcriptional regulator